MHILQSDIERISALVIGELADRRLDLAEKTRQIFIAKAIRTWATSGNEAMELELTWELDLLPAMKRANDRHIRICSIDEMRNQDRLVAYLTGIGCNLMKGLTYFTVIPKSYATTDVRKRIRDILKGMA